MRTKVVFLIAFEISFLLSLRSYGQIFSEVGTSIPPILGSSDWGDYDADGDLDLLVTGTGTWYPDYTPTAQIYTNNGNGAFALLPVNNLLPVINGEVKWLDYNNDGYLDILLSGEYYDELWQNWLPKSVLYKGKGDHTYEDSGNTFVDAENSGMDWGDFNNDGRVDIAMSGFTEMWPSYHGNIYENHNGSFVESTKFRIHDLASGSLKCGDYDNDGDIDLLHVGSYWDLVTPYEIGVTNIYRNDVDSFATVNFENNGVSYGYAEWGDYDNDGDLDILESGNEFIQVIANGYFMIYRNDGDDQFQKIAIEGLSDKVYGLSRWGDYDNDGDLDIIVSGSYREGADGFTYMYRNDNGIFSKSETLCELSATSINPVDYDNDGDLDIYLSCAANYTHYSKLFRNNSSMANARPFAPAGTKVTVNKKEVNFSWLPSTDDHTNQKSLTYTVSVGSSPGNSFVMGPNSILSTGQRKVVNFGNTSLDTCWKLKIENEGRYYWQVQAIDNSYAGSAFSEAGSFSIGVFFALTDEAGDIDPTSCVLNGRVYPGTLSADVFFEYGTDTTQLSATAPASFQGDSTYIVNTQVHELTQNTLYYYRIKAMNLSDTVSGRFVTFRTMPDGLQDYSPVISFYPNPGSGIFHFDTSKFPDGEVLIYDGTGRERAKFDSKEIRNSNRIDISNLEDGLYTLILTCQKYTNHYRIIKVGVK